MSSGRAPGQAWPAWINIPSKIGQVAAVRVLAGQRRAEDLQRGILIASISPGLIDTGASRAWLDLTDAPQPDEVAGPASGSHPRHPSVLEPHMTEVGREALHSARERVDPIERRVFGVFAPKDMAAFREFLSRFIEAFEGE